MPTTPSLWFDRSLVAAAVVSTCVLFLPAAGDPVNIVKLTAAVLAALALAAVAGVRAARSRTLELPWGPPAALGFVLLAAFGTAALAAPEHGAALLGAYGRNSGLLAYVSALALFFAVLRSFTPSSARILALALMGAGAFTAAYGLLQYAGADAFRWNNPFNPIIAALGNPDFASGYLGICTPAAAWGAVHMGWPRLARIGCGALAATFLITAALSSAVQGPLAAIGGLLVLGLAWLLERGWLTRRRLATLAAAGLAAGGALIVVGVAGHGPVASQFSGISYRARTWYWHAALTMWQRHPLQGVGLDMYGLYWRRDRPLEAVRVLGGNSYSDAAHSVPLQHLAQGGLLLGAAYVALVGYVAFALVRGLRRLEGSDRLLLGGLGGAWTAYQLESFISIDQVPLLVAHYVLAGAVLVVCGRARLRPLRLPGALPVAPASAPRPGRRPRQPVVRVRRPTAVDHATAACVVSVALVASYLALTPLRASLAFYDGEGGIARGDGNAAQAGYERAIQLEPDVGLYSAKLGELYTMVKHNDQALTAFRTAFDRDKTQIGAAINAARLAEAGGKLGLAGALLAEAVRVDPTNSMTVVEYAGFQTRQRHADYAVRVLVPLVRALPKDAALWAALGDGQQGLGETTNAMASYKRALRLQADQPVALAGLRSLEKAQ